MQITTNTQMRRPMLPQRTCNTEGWTHQYPQTIQTSALIYYNAWRPPTLSSSPTAANWPKKSPASLTRYELHSPFPTHPKRTTHSNMISAQTHYGPSARKQSNSTVRTQHVTTLEQGHIPRRTSVKQQGISQTAYLCNTSTSQ